MKRAPNQVLAYWCNERRYVNQQFFFHRFRVFKSDSCFKQLAAIKRESQQPAAQKMMQDTGARTSKQYCMWLSCERDSNSRCNISDKSAFGVGNFFTVQRPNYFGGRAPLDFSLERQCFALRHSHVVRRTHEAGTSLHGFC